MAGALPTATGALPPISPYLLAGFRWYVRRYVRRHFSAVRLLGSAPDLKGPSLVYLNHASWWDPLICLLLAEHMVPASRSSHRAYAPIDADALQKYRFFSRIGFFAVKRNSVAGARAFLRTGAAVLADPQATLWVTPQGRFADPRERPIRIEPGIAELALRSPGTRCFPLAIEYPFWTERTPEALAAFGQPIQAPGGVRKAEFAAILEAGLTAIMDVLRDAGIERSASRFRIVLSGTSGLGGVYDLWRSAMALVRGQRPDTRHGGSDEP